MKQPIDPDRLAPAARHTPHEGARRGGPQPDTQDAPDDERRDTGSHANEPPHSTEPNPTE